MASFTVQSDYQPCGDQPDAIRVLTESLQKGNKYQALLGVTGSGKTFTMAKLIEQLQKPALIISHNKTLAAQLYREFREFFPYNAVEYFVSYYDYYQPEAYVPQRDLYIEKDAMINEEIDSLRLRATSALISRPDVIVVASVSCIYGLGSPEDYKAQVLIVRKGEKRALDEILSRLVHIQYTRNSMVLEPGQFRVKGDTLDIYPPYAREGIKVEFFDRTVEAIYHFDPLTGDVREKKDNLIVYPAKHFITSPEKLERAVKMIRSELKEREENLKSKGKIVEAQRLRSRTNYDIEMMQEMGYCNGIENYSRHLSGRAPGSAGATLLDYFPDDYLVMIDESHVTLPQLKGMYRGDRARKENLVEYGFRLPSAYDNRPLFYEEFDQIVPHMVFVSATLGDEELRLSAVKAEQVIRPTGLVDPEVIVRPVDGQVPDLLAEIREAVKKNGRVLATTLTKKMAEDLTGYLLDQGIRAKYLHSEINTLERVEIIRDLRKGLFDCLVGVNLLREGLDMPEVRLVAILDADKEGFLRSRTSLIQTAGRAARNAEGRVIFYAGQETGSIRAALDETRRRREVQTKYNSEHGITPRSIEKNVVDIIEREKQESFHEAEQGIINLSKKLSGEKKRSDSEWKKEYVKRLKKLMVSYADELEFEKAAIVRDKLAEVEEKS